MKRNTLSDLSDLLMDTIMRVKDSNDPDADLKDTIDTDKAKQIANLAGKVIDIGKLEVEAIKLVASTEGYTNASNQLNKSGILALKEGDDEPVKNVNDAH